MQIKIDNALAQIKGLMAGTMPPSTAPPAGGGGGRGGRGQTGAQNAAEARPQGSDGVDRAGGHAVAARPTPCSSTS